MARLSWALIVVLGLGTASFLVARVLPGDPVRMLLGPQARPDDIERARKIHGLDGPVWYQYGRFWQRLVHTYAGDDPQARHTSCANPIGSLHVDLGHSYRYRRPVVELIAERAPRSLMLAVAAFLLQLTIRVGSGVLAAYRRGSVIDQLAIGATLIGVSAPTFALGLLLQYVFAHRLGWLPHDGYGATLDEQLASLILPALTLGLFSSALYARLVRTEVAKALASPHALTTAAKGASPLRVHSVHGGGRREE